MHVILDIPSLNYINGRIQVLIKELEILPFSKNSVSSVKAMGSEARFLFIIAL